MTFHNIVFFLKQNHTHLNILAVSPSASSSGESEVQNTL